MKLIDTLVNTLVPVYNFMSDSSSFHVVVSAMSLATSRPGKQMASAKLRVGSRCVNSKVTSGAGL